MISFATTSAAPLALTASEITITRQQNLVLSRAGLSLRSGQFVSLVGPSGSGKTSLLRVLALLDQADQGELMLWNQKFDLKEKACPYIPPVYPALTYVPQTIGLWPHLSVAENLRFALQPGVEGDAIRQMSEQLEIADILDRRPAHVSQGQRQRAALARALLLKPKILLLDEVTASLDDRLATKIWAVLRASARLGVTILASTHDARLSDDCDGAFRISGNTLKPVESTGGGR